MTFTGAAKVAPPSVLRANITSLTTVGILLGILFIAAGINEVVFAGAVGGGFLGGRLVRVLPAPAVRWIVIAAGSALTLVYAWRYWLP